MPVIKALATILVCDFCPATTSHVAGTGAPLSAEYFETRHWTVDVDTVACPRCAPILNTVVEHTGKGLDLLFSNRPNPTA